MGFDLQRTEGELFASDQYGYLLRITPPPLGQSTGTKVERLKLRWGKRTGSCWAFDASISWAANDGRRR